MGPAASPMSKTVPNTPIAAPRPRAEARSAVSALVTGVTAPTPRPSSGATRMKAVRLSLRNISGSAVAQSSRPMTMTGIRPIVSFTPLSESRKERPMRKTLVIAGTLLLATPATSAMPHDADSYQDFFNHSLDHAQHQRFHQQFNAEHRDAHEEGFANPQEH